MFPAGKLDRYIDIERATLSNDDFNAPTQAWGLLKRVPARVMSISDGERFRAGETFSSISTRFQISYTVAVANLDTRDRVTYEGRTYDIVGVKEIGRREGLEITASARAEAP